MTMDRSSRYPPRVAAPRGPGREPEGCGRRFTVPVRVARPGFRLVCFPYSGAGASVYFSWGREFARDGIELWNVQYPGRESRIAEPPIVTFARMIQTLVDAFGAMPADLPLAFFGHSLGTVIAHALACELSRLGKPAPVHLFLSGRNAPHHLRELDRMHELDDAALIEAVARFGNLPESVRNEPELMELLVPILRADFALLHDYHQTRPPPEETPILSCPISVFGGEDDPWTSPCGLAEWQRYTTRGFVLRTYPGHHFFLNQSPDSIRSAIREDLCASARPRERRDAI